MTQTNGKQQTAGGSSADSTDRMRAEEDLRRSEAYLAEAQRLSHTGSFGWKVSTGELLWSAETFRIIGYDSGTTPTLTHVLKRVHPDDQSRVNQILDRAMSEGGDVDCEHRLLMPDGTVKHVHVVARPIQCESGGIEYVGAISDVTTAKIAEERSRRDERELRQIVEAIHQLITVMAPDGRILYVNKPVLDFTGLTMDEVMSESFRRLLFHPDDLQKLRSQREEGFARGVPFALEQRARRHDGQYVWFLTRFSPLLDEQGRILRWYATGTDIDDRKRAEERVLNENLALRQELNETAMFEDIVGTSPALQTVLERVSRVAPTDSTVLIVGETGTGKELVARAIHRRSGRASGPFVSVNCAAFAQPLIASELFGHEKGAFTGALQQRLGRFELAERGTIFLDEIGEMPPETQIALLRVLQEREFERVGGNKPIRTDVRVIAATHRDLQSSLAGGSFRGDLFYRLNVFPIHLPPLRERREDIPLLAEYFIQRLARKLGKKIRRVDGKTLAQLKAFPWPGNIRELQNVIERSMITSEADVFSIDESWLTHDSTTAPSSALDLPGEIVARERKLIEAALADSKGQVSGPSGAAARLGIPPSTLDSRIRSLRINKHQYKSR